MIGGISTRWVGYKVREPAGFAIDRPGGHGDWIVLLFTGPIDIADGGPRRVLPAGSAALYAPGQPHRYHGAGGHGFTHHWCHLHGPGVAEAVAACAVASGTAVPLAEPGRLAAAFAALHREHRGSDRQAGVATQAAALLVLAELARSQVRAAADPRQAALSDLRGRMLAEPARAWSVAGLARMVGLSPGHLRTAWRKAFGCAPLADLLARRIAVGQDRLARGSTVADAAAAAGFADPRYFIRCFRVRLGITPGRWRAQQR